MRNWPFRRLVTFLSTLLFLAFALPAFAGSAALEPMEISVRPIMQFRIGREDRNFGPLEFVGGLAMTSYGRDFGGLSAFRFLKPGSDFIGVADTGFWFFGTLVRDADLRPSGVENFRMARMVDEAGRPLGKKGEADAEGLAVRDGIATVGFERNHRIAQYRIDPNAMAGPLRQLDFLVPRKELRQNRGFETVAASDPDGPLQGALVIVSEKSLDPAGNNFAAILSGPRKGIFTVKRDGEAFDITDGAFLPGGDMLVLERSFSMIAGVKMRLRRLRGEGIVSGGVADGPVLMEADMGYQIDNMEGLDVWRRHDGALMVSLISDDNHSILQRNLYLEFVLHAE
jgi:hypothetical protein